MDTLASLVENGYLGNRLTRQEREGAGLERGEYVGCHRALMLAELSKRSSAHGEYFGRDAPDGTAIGNGLRL